MPFSAAAAALRTAWAKLWGYRVLATLRERDKRLNRCQPCDELTDDRQCALCGCFVDAKVSLTMEQCPKRRWRRIWKKNTVKKT